MTTETAAAKVTRQTLRLVARAAEKAADTERKRNAAIRFAHDQGASLREIAEAAGIPHMTVKRIIERTPASENA